MHVCVFIGKSYQTPFLGGGKTFTNNKWDQRCSDLFDNLRSQLLLFSLLQPESNI